MATGPQPTPGQPGEGREDQFWRNPLLHIIACLAILVIGALVTLATQLLM